MEALHLIDGWDVPFAAAGVTRADGTVATRGDTQRAVPLASVSKPVSALATLVAAEEGVVDLDETAGPPGSTVRHLLAHASGLQFENRHALAEPGTWRIYSNVGFDVLGELVGARAEMPFAAYFEHVWGFPLTGPPGSGVEGSLEQLVVVARELLA